jgi:hypothetical protein
MMNEVEGFAVFFFPQALEALGEAIKPYLHDGPMGEHVLCNEVDTAGALIEMTIVAQTTDGRTATLELMVPTSMVKMIVSARSDTAFGFGPRMTSVPMATLPPVAGDAPAATESAKALPDAGDTPTETPQKP